jgi:hypothetical protein
MAWLVTDAHHREVCALYEQRLVAAAERVREAEERADKEVQNRRVLEEKLVEHIFAKPEPAAAPVRRRPAEPAVEHIDVPLDASDDKAILRQAARETGSRNARVVMARAQYIKDQLNRGQRHTRRAAVQQMTPTDVQTYIDKAAKEAEQAAYDEANAGAVAARSAAS